MQIDNFANVVHLYFQTLPWFDIESIIDDWVMMGFLVGNDFIPNLPNMHINHGALPDLYKIYIKLLPSLNGECCVRASRIAKVTVFYQFCNVYSIIKLLWLFREMQRPLMAVKFSNQVIQDLICSQFLLR